jgi:multiple sugar transport system ATP-binding protein
MPELVLNGVRKKYGNVHALDNVNLTIQDGDFCIIVGPSGSGKTSLLHTIAGFVKPDEGEVFVDGMPFNRLLPRERNIGMVFQDIALFSHMSVRKNLSFGLEIKRRSKREIETRVGKIADMLKIRKLLDKKPRLLSGGEAQRVAIGRALITDPSFFLFDEPMGNLDANLRMEMLTEIKRLHLELGKTFIYVTHDQEQTLAAATKVVVMKEGKVMQQGHPSEIYFNPANRFVAEFFGISAMNLIDGRLAREPRGPVFRGAGLALVLPSYARYADTAVTLGVRPEAVSIGQEGSQQAGVGTVNIVELLGDENHISLTLEQEKRITAIASTKVRPRIDDRMGIGLREESIFLFDAEQGGRLRP